jgi:hypothetical protein
MWGAGEKVFSNLLKKMDLWQANELAKTLLKAGLFRRPFVKQRRL